MAEAGSVREFWRLLNAPCEEMASLISISLDRDLSRSQRVAVKLHLLYCKACRRYRRQIRLMREALRAIISQMEGAELSSGPALGAEARERIRRALTQA